MHSIPCHLPRHGRRSSSCHAAPRIPPRRAPHSAPRGDVARVFPRRGGGAREGAPRRARPTPPRGRSPRLRARVEDGTARLRASRSGKPPEGSSASPPRGATAPPRRGHPHARGPRLSRDRLRPGHHRPPPPPLARPPPRRLARLRILLRILDALLRERRVFPRRRRRAPRRRARRAPRRRRESPRGLHGSDGIWSAFGAGDSDLVRRR